MKPVQMKLEGSDAEGWLLRIWCGELELFSTERLAREDLDAALFEIQRDSSRRNVAFDRLSDVEVFFLLNGFFQGPLSDALRASAEEQTWARHKVSPSVRARVHSVMYLVERDDGTEHLFVAKEVLIRPAGEFDAELRRVRHQLTAS